jgi:sulfate adenylyltransferase
MFNIFNKIINFNTLYKPGLCIYLTGLSGSGKSTISNILKEDLSIIDKSRVITILDGDEIRENISKGLGFSKEDRSINIRRIGYVAHHITNNNGIVICANIAPYKEDRLYNRNLIESNNNKYIEVYLDVDVKECMRRDPKGLYKINTNSIVESSKDYEIPTNNEITINSILYNPNESSNIICEYLKNHKLI